MLSRFGRYLVKVVEAVEKRKYDLTPSAFCTVPPSDGYDENEGPLIRLADMDALITRHNH